MTPKQNETTKTALYSPGARARITNARSGPIMAPSVSSARCTLNEVARFSGVLFSEIIASRGAVRIPLPTRSAITTAVSAGTALPASGIASRDTVDRP